MKYSKHIEHNVHVRPYETVTIGASVDWNEEDDFSAGDIDDLLTSLIQDDLVQAKNVSDNGSYIHDWELSNG